MLLPLHMLPPRCRLASFRLRGFLTLLLLATASVAFAQSTLYGLATTYSTFAFGNPAQPKGRQALITISPTTGQPTSTNFSPITGITVGQILVGIDFRPNTGQLYGLGYDTLTTNTQLYILTPVVTGSAITTSALAVNTVPVMLPLTTVGTGSVGTSSKRIGFDFNPAADRIRVVSANGADYRLNPNTGGIVAQDGNLAYSASDPVTMPVVLSSPPTISPNPPTTPGVGTVAYTNSNFGATSTILYDDDELNYGILSVQSPPNSGLLTMPKLGTFTSSSGTFQLTAQLIALDIDIYYNRSTGQNTAYLTEVTGNSSNTLHASNLYTLNLATGQATLVGNTIPRSALQPFDIIDIAAPVPVPLVWNGSVSDEWGTAANWTPAQVPTSADDAFIPGATPNQPTVRSAQQALSVALNTGATLTLASGGTLSLNGNFANTGGTVAGNGTGLLALVGSAVQSVGGSVLSTFPNLRVGAAGATTAGPVAIQSTGSLSLIGNLAVGTSQAFTLNSDANGTAYVINNGTAVATGAVTVQRYITPTNAGAGYRHYSTPVSGNTVANFTTTGFTPTVNAAYNSSPTPPTVTPFPTVYSYDQSRLGLTNTSPEFDKGFLSPSALTDPLTVGLGYTVNLPGTALVSFVGTLNNGSISLTGLNRGTQATAGYQLLGNPYPSAIDYNVVLSNSPGIESALYVFKSSGQYTGTYTSYVNGASANTGTNLLPTAQGFFVRVASGQTGTVNFTNAARLTTANNTLFQRTTADPRPHLALTLRNAAIANQTYVYFEQGATAGFDTGFDAHYLPATHGLDLATEISTESLSINGQPELSGALVTVPLRLSSTAAGTYTLAVDELANLPGAYHAYLRDALTGSYTDLATTPSISLTLAAGAAATGRYAVVFTTSQPLATASAATAQLVSLYPNPAHGTASLLLPQALRTGAATQVAVVDNLGRTVLTRTLAATDLLELPLTTLAPGIYSVQAQTNAGVVAKRLVVK